MGSLFINNDTLFAISYRYAVMPLLCLNKFDFAMAVLVVIPIYKRSNPLAGFFFAIEWPVFNSAQ